MQPPAIEVGRLQFNHPRMGAVDALLFMRAYQVDSTPSLQLVSHDTHEPLWTVSVNMSGHGHTPDERCVFLKCYSENEGLLEPLVASGLIECTGKCIKLDHVTIPEARINLPEDLWSAFAVFYTNWHERNPLHVGAVLNHKLSIN